MKRIHVTKAFLLVKNIHDAQKSRPVNSRLMFGNCDFSGINDEIFITLIDVFLQENHLKNLKTCSTRLCKNKINLYNFTVIIVV